MDTSNESQSPRSVPLTLRSQKTVPLTAADIASTAVDMDTGDASHQRVIVGDKLVDALEVVAGASGFDPDHFQSSQAFEVLRQLGFDLVDDPKRSPKHDRPALPEYRDPITPDDQADDDFLVITPELARRFRPFRGRWVAVRNSGEVIADDKTLDSLHAALDRISVEDAPATITVFYVPDQWRPDGGDP